MLDVRVWLVVPVCPSTGEPLLFVAEFAKILVDEERVEVPEEVFKPVAVIIGLPERPDEPIEDVLDTAFVDDVLLPPLTPLDVMALVLEADAESVREDVPVDIVADVDDVDVVPDLSSEDDSAVPDEDVPDECEALVVALAALTPDTVTLLVAEADDPFVLVLVPVDDVEEDLDVLVSPECDSKGEPLAVVALVLEVLDAPDALFFPVVGVALVLEAEVAPDVALVPVVWVTLALVAVVALDLILLPVAVAADACVALDVLETALTPVAVVADAFDVDVVS